MYLESGLAGRGISRLGRSWRVCFFCADAVKFLGFFGSSLSYYHGFLRGYPALTRTRDGMALRVGGGGLTVALELMNIRRDLKPMTHTIPHLHTSMGFNLIRLPSGLRAATS